MAVLGTHYPKTSKSSESKSAFERPSYLKAPKKKKGLTPEEFESMPPDAQMAYTTGNFSVLRETNPELANILEDLRGGERPSSVMTEGERLAKALHGVAPAYQRAGMTEVPQGEQGFLGAIGGAVSTVGDILSTGNFMMAEGFNRLTSLLQGEGVTPSGSPANSPDDVIWGMIGGLTHRNKNTFADTLVNAYNMDSTDDLALWQQGLALAGDIFIDPINLVGAGLASKGIKGAAAAMDIIKEGDKVSDIVKATGALGELTDDALTLAKVDAEMAKPVLDQIDELAKAEAIRGLDEAQRGGNSLADAIRSDPDYIRNEATRTFRKLPNTASRNVEARTAREFAEREGLDWDTLPKQTQDAFRTRAAQAYVDAAQYTASRHLSLWTGQEVSPALGLKWSKSAVALAKKLGISNGDMAAKMWRIPATAGIALRAEKMASGSKWAQAVHKAFSPNKAYGKAPNVVRRIYENVYGGKYEAASRAFLEGLDEVVKEKLPTMTTADQKLIAEALDLGDTSALNAGQLEVHNWMQDFFGGLYGDLKATGFYAGEEASTTLDNFFPYYYTRRPDAKLKKDIRQQRFVHQATGAKQRAFQALEGTALEGKVNTDLRDIAKMYLRDYYGMKARNNTITAMIDHFGLRVAKKRPKGKPKGKPEYVSKMEAKVESNYRKAGARELHEVLGMDKNQIKSFFGNVYETKRGGKDIDDIILLDPDKAEVLKAIYQSTEFDEVTAGLLGAYRGAIQAIKQSLTLPNLGFHLRNARGDYILNSLDGVKGRSYTEGMKGLLTGGNKRALFESIDPKLFEGKTGAQIEKLLADATPTNQKINFRGGLPTMDANEFFKHYVNSGAKSGYLRAERQIINSRRPLNRLANSLRNVTETREDIGRIAHFHHAMEEELLQIAGKGKEIDEAAKILAADRAAARVRKYNIDYGDLTLFESKLRAYGVPFYTWTRKNLPLQFEHIFTRPGMQAGFFKAHRAMQTAVADEDANAMLMPAWLRKLYPIELGQRLGPGNFFAGLVAGQIPGMASGVIPGEPGLMGTDVAFTGFNDIPLFSALQRLDMFKPMMQAISAGDPGGTPSALWQGFTGEFGADINPIAQFAIQGMTGENLFTGQEQEASLGRFTESLMPAMRALPAIAAQLTPDEMDPFLQSVADVMPGEARDITSPEAIASALNYLGATGTQVVTPSRKISEVNRALDVLRGTRQQNRSAAADYLNLGGG